MNGHERLRQLRGGFETVEQNPPVRRILFAYVNLLAPLGNLRQWLTFFQASMFLVLADWIEALDSHFLRNFCERRKKLYFQVHLYKPRRYQPHGA